MSKFGDEFKRQYRNYLQSNKAAYLFPSTQGMKLEQRHAVERQREANRKVFLAAGTALKNLINKEILHWASLRLSDVEVRTQYSLYTSKSTWSHKYFVMDIASLHNGKGGVDKKQHWLNKVSVNEGVVFSHVARTDPEFLDLELPSDFQKFIKYLSATINTLCEEAVEELSKDGR